MAYMVQALIQWSAWRIFATMCCADALYNNCPWAAVVAMLWHSNKCVRIRCGDWLQQSKLSLRRYVKCVSRLTQCRRQTELCCALRIPLALSRAYKQARPTAITCRRSAWAPPETPDPLRSWWSAERDTPASVPRRAPRWRWNHDVQTRRRSRLRRPSSGWPAAPGPAERQWRRHISGWSRG